MTAADCTTIYFSDVFGVDAQVIEDYGAFNISLINDLPLFIDAYFVRFRSPVSLQGDRPFRLKPITRFAPSRSPISLEADQSIRPMAIIA